MEPIALPRDLPGAAASCLAVRDPTRKMELTAVAADAWEAGLLQLEPDRPSPPIDEPGRPDRPVLVSPRELPRRSLANIQGRAALIHAVAHIEFNAINLAWDVVQRFGGMPRAFYADWVRVAREEAYHFGLMRQRLWDLGSDYGAFPAHDGLWDMARRTAHDPLVRMALVPRVLEARGLDVTPAMIERFRAAGDSETAAALEIILRDEIGHVAAGSRWFRTLCEGRGLDAETVYFDLVDEYLRGEIRCPLNLADRRRAGFGDGELDRLEAMCAKRDRSRRKP